MCMHIQGPRALKYEGLVLNVEAGRRTKACQHSYASNCLLLDGLKDVSNGTAGVLVRI